MIGKRLRLFGSRRRTEIVVMMGLLEETYASELARLLDAPLYSVQQILGALEGEGVLVSRLRGRTRIFEIDPRFHAADQLRSLLLQLARGEPELQRAASTRRSRPRRAGTPL